MVVQPVVPQLASLDPPVVVRNTSRPTLPVQNGPVQVQWIGDLLLPPTPDA